MSRPAFGPAIRTHGVRPSEKTALRVIPGFSPRGHPSLDSPRGGAGSARPRERYWLHPGTSPLGHRVFAYASAASGMPRPSYGRPMRTHRVRPSEKTPSRVIPGFSPLGHPSLDSPPLGGPGSARLRERYWLHPGISPLGHRVFAYASAASGMPRPSYGRPMRTHRVRPSEKTPSRVIPGFSPLGHPSLDSPPLGGPGSARLRERYWLHPGISPLGHRVFAYASAASGMPRPSYGRPMRTHRVRPSEKTAFGAISGLSPQGRSSLDSPPRGGAGSARPQMRLCFHRGDHPIRPPGVRLPPLIMLGLGLRPASQCVRTECVPPTTPPFAPSPGLPREAIRAGLAPAQGRFVPEDQGQASSASQLGALNGVFPNSRAWAPSGHLESLHEFATTVRLLRNIAPTATKGVRSPPNAAASATEL